MMKDKFEQLKPLLLKVQAVAFWILIIFLSGVYVGQYIIKDEVVKVFEKAERLGGYVDKNGKVYEVKRKVIDK